MLLEAFRQNIHARFMRLASQTDSKARELPQGSRWQWPCWTELMQPQKTRADS